VSDPTLHGSARRKLSSVASAPGVSLDNSHDRTTDNGMGNHCPQPEQSSLSLPYFSGKRAVRFLREFFGGNAPHSGPVGISAATGAGSDVGTSTGTKGLEFMTFICAWNVSPVCEKRFGRAIVANSHGMCPACREHWRDQLSQISRQNAEEVRATKRTK